MEQLTNGLLKSNHSEDVKLALIKHLRDRIQNFESTEDFTDVVFVCISHIHDQIGINSKLADELCLLVFDIIMKLPDESYQRLSSNLQLNFSCNNDRKVDSIIAGIHKLRMKNALCLDVGESFFFTVSNAVNVSLKRHLLESDIEFCQILSSALVKLSAAEHFVENLSTEECTNLTVQLFNVLVALDPPLQVATHFFLCLDATLAENASRLLKLLVTRNPSVSCLGPRLISLFSNILMDSDSSHYYTPLASLLFALETDNLTEYWSGIVCSLISTVTWSNIVDVDTCFRVLRRLTVWLAWPEVSENCSPVDKWLIGFQCELFRKFSDEHFSKFLEFIDWQLQFSIELLLQLPYPHEAVMNAFAFFLLSGTLTSTDCRLKSIAPKLPALINKFVSAESQVIANYKFKMANRRLYVISRLVEAILSSLPGFTPFQLSELSNSLEKLFRMFQDRNTNSIWLNRSKIYHWDSLFRFGANAGSHLRKVWCRWSGDDEVRFVGAPFADVTVSQQKIVNHCGLLNVGNTCYANAALQLLFHCHAFRNIILETASQSDGRYLCHSTHQITSNTSLESLNGSKNEVNLKFSRSAMNSSGSLFSQLFSLFHLLNAQKTPSVRDLYDVLTVTKPAHFITGEQQDAVEYLNHLLDRLHEEELSLRNSAHGTNRIDQNGEQHEMSSTLLSNKCSPSRLECDVHSASCTTVINANTEVCLVTSNQKEKPSQLSRILELFGGTLVRHTSCIECKHVSSTRREQFLCLYLPLTKPNTQVCYDGDPSDSSTSVPNNLSKDVECSEHLIVDPSMDLASLIEAHFTQIEHVSSLKECESCGKQTLQARRLALQELSSHVLICLNLFTFCRAKKTTSKIMHRIRIPERLSVTLTSSGNAVNEPNQDTFGIASPKEFTRAQGKPTSRTYKLQAMILHHGVSISCGHYTCVARVGMQWILFDDDIADYTTLEQIYAEPLVTPYLLLYSRV